MRKAIAILFAIAFFPCAIVSQGLFAVNSWLFNPQFFSSMVDNPALYDAIIQEIGYYDFYNEAVETFSFEEFNLETNQNISPIPTEALNFIKPDPQEISRQASFAVQQFVNALDGQQNNIYIQVNMQAMKDLLAGPYGTGILAVHAGNIPVCTAGQDPTQQAGIVEALSLPTCRNQNINEAMFGLQLIANQREIAETFPSFLTYEVPIFQTQAEFQTVEAFAAAKFSFGDTIAKVAIFALLAWLASGWLMFKNNRRRAIWMGILLIVPSALVIAFGSSISNVLLSGLAQTVSQAPTDQVGFSFAQSIATGITQVGGSFVSTGLFFVVIGAVAIALGFGLDRLRPQTVKKVVSATKTVATTTTSTVQSAVGTTKTVVSSTSSTVQSAVEASKNIGSATNESLQTAVEKTKSVTTSTTHAAQSAANIVKGKLDDSGIRDSASATVQKVTDSEQVKNVLNKSSKTVNSVTSSISDMAKSDKAQQLKDNALKGMSGILSRKKSSDNPDDEITITESESVTIRVTSSETIEDDFSDWEDIEDVTPEPNDSITTVDDDFSDWEDVEDVTPEPNDSITTVDDDFSDWEDIEDVAPEPNDSITTVDDDFSDWEDIEDVAPEPAIDDKVDDDFSDWEDDADQPEK